MINQDIDAEAELSRILSEELAADFERSVEEVAKGESMMKLYPEDEKMRKIMARWACSVTVEELRRKMWQGEMP